MIAKLPVYGTTDAGMNLYLRRKESSREFGLIASQIFSALYFLMEGRHRHYARLFMHARRRSVGSAWRMVKENAQFRSSWIDSKLGVFSRINSDSVAENMSNILTASL